MGMPSARIGADEVKRAGRATLQVGDQTVVVFPVDGRFVAYVDACAHLGGPVCSQGSLRPFYTARVREDGRVEPYFADGGEQVLACPWHGWEYDLASGRCLADGSKLLRAAEVSDDNGELVISL